MEFPARPQRSQIRARFTLPPQQDLVLPVKVTERESEGGAVVQRTLSIVAGMVFVEVKSVALAASEGSAHR